MILIAAFVGFMLGAGVVYMFFIWLLKSVGLYEEFAKALKRSTKLS